MDLQSKLKAIVEIAVISEFLVLTFFIYEIVWGGSEQVVIIEFGILMVCMFTIIIFGNKSDKLDKSIKSSQNETK
jgi:hypothetical protein